MKEKILSRHGTIRAFALAIGKHVNYVRRQINEADAGNAVAQAKVEKWLGEPLRIRTRQELSRLITATGKPLAVVEAEVKVICPTANLHNYLNKVSDPKIATPLYAAICKHLGLPPYKQD